MKFATNTWDAEQFWKSPPPLPPGLVLERGRVLLEPRPGPGGADAFEEVTLRAPGRQVALLVAYKAPLSARDVVTLKVRLQRALEQRRVGELGAPDLTPRVPAVVTNVAQPAVRAACDREWLGLLDQSGTVLLHEGPLYLHVLGKGRVERKARATLFRGRGARVLRFLLASPGAPHAVAQVARQCETSVAYTHAVLRALEEQGLVGRDSARSGFKLTRPTALLQAWLDSGARAAAVIEGFYAPSSVDTERLSQLLSDRRVPHAWTLAAAIPPSQVVVGALPTGLYFAGDATVLIEELKLRRTAPHNFLVLHPEPAAATTSFGVFRSGVNVVSAPQLVLDLAALGGPRGQEQAAQVMRNWAKSLEERGR